MPPVTLQLFDYKTVIIEHQLSNVILNSFGTQGWELVDVEIEHDSPIPGVAVEYLCVFKRPVPTGGIPDNSRSPVVRVSGR